jgi:hypothetical protein
MCVDYRLLNDITIKNRYPLPNIADLLDMLYGSTVYSSLDLIAGYHQVALQQSDIPNTAFRTPLGHFECLVLWEGLTNAPSVFQSIMQKILKPYLGKFAALYLDDIMIFSKTMDDHVSHLDQILTALETNNFHVKLSKSNFTQEELVFLGHVISKNGTSIDLSKIKAVQDWPEPTTTTEIRSFCGLCNYFHKYIKDYTKLAAPLTGIQNHKGKWPPDHFGPLQRYAFKSLKDAITSFSTMLGITRHGWGFVWKKPLHS